MLRPRKVGVAARPATLPDGALAGLPELDPRIVVRFSGPDGGAPAQPLPELPRSRGLPDPDGHRRRSRLPRDL